MTTRAARCSTCNAPLLWARTERGKFIPLDAEPEATGNIVLLCDGTAIVIPGPTDHDAPDCRFVSHFATCPQAGRHRRTR